MLCALDVTHVIECTRHPLIVVGEPGSMCLYLYVQLVVKILYILTI